MKAQEIINSIEDKQDLREMFYKEKPKELTAQEQADKNITKILKELK